MTKKEREREREKILFLKNIARLISSVNLIFARFHHQERELVLPTLFPTSFSKVSSIGAKQRDGKKQLIRTESQNPISKVSRCQQS